MVPGTGISEAGLIGRWLAGAIERRIGKGWIRYTDFADGLRHFVLEDGFAVRE